jgi:two-component system, NtrC family, nitrogen regulation response regulator NtrX
MQLISSGAEYKHFDIAALNALRNAQWPGDFAQLESVVRNLIQTSLEEKITLNDVNRILHQFDIISAPKLDSVVQASRDQESKSTNTTFKLAPPPIDAITEHTMPDLNLPLREARDAFERLYFEHHIKTTTNNMSKLAEIAGLERTHLYRKLKQLGLKTKG